MKKKSFYELFIKTENSFKPRKNYKHADVVKELSNIVFDADCVINNLREMLEAVQIEKIGSFDKGLYLGLFLGIIGSACLTVLLFLVGSL